MFIFNSFTEIQVAYPAINLFTVCDSMVFSIFTEACCATVDTNFRTFSSP